MIARHSDEIGNRVITNPDSLFDKRGETSGSIPGPDPPYPIETIQKETSLHLQLCILFDGLKEKTIKQCKYYGYLKDRPYWKESFIRLPLDRVMVRGKRFYRYALSASSIPTDGYSNDMLSMARFNNDYSELDSDLRVKQPSKYYEYLPPEDRMKPITILNDYTIKAYDYRPDRTNPQGNIFAREFLSIRLYHGPFKPDRLCIPTKRPTPRYITRRKGQRPLYYKNEIERVCCRKTGKFMYHNDSGDKDNDVSKGKVNAGSFMDGFSEEVCSCYQFAYLVDRIEGLLDPLEFNIVQLLSEGGTKKGAAKEAGIGRTWLYHNIKIIQKKLRTLFEEELLQAPEAVPEHTYIHFAGEWPHDDNRWRMFKGLPLLKRTVYTVKNKSKKVSKSVNTGMVFDYRRGERKKASFFLHKRLRQTANSTGVSHER